MIIDIVSCEDASSAQLSVLFSQDNAFILEENLMVHSSGTGLMEVPGVLRTGRKMNPIGWGNQG